MPVCRAAACGAGFQPASSTRRPSTANHVSNNLGSTSSMHEQRCFVEPVWVVVGSWETSGASAIACISQYRVLSALFFDSIAREAESFFSDLGRAETSARSKATGRWVLTISLPGRAPLSRFERGIELKRRAHPPVQPYNPLVACSCCASDCRPT